MPRYSYNLDDFIIKLLLMSPEKRLKIIRRMYNILPNAEQKAAFALLYIYGLRPAELLELKQSNFQQLNDNTLRVFLPTKKGGKTRIIDLNINETPFLKETWEFIKSRPWKIFPRWNHVSILNNTIFKTIYEVLGINISPYAFRHYRLSFIMYNGGDVHEVAAWKGASDIRSVMPYLRFKPVSKFKRKIS